MSSILHPLSRFLSALVAIWGVLTIVFFVMRIVPGDPAILMLGPDATPDQLLSIRERLGLNQSIVHQYLHYIVAAIQIDFGKSIEFETDATKLVISRIPQTAILALASVGLGYAWGIPLGIAAARRANGLVDKFVSSAALTVLSVPGFWIGLMLIMIFSSHFRWLPSGGYGTFKHLIMPAITLSLPVGGMVARFVRGSLLDVLSREYIEAARARGLSENRVIYVHAMVNIAIPLLTVMALQLGALLGGAVVIETVFAWPGVGRLLVSAILSRDYPVVQATVIFIAVLFVVLNLVVDLLYTALDPRIRMRDV